MGDKNFQKLIKTSKNVQTLETTYAHIIPFLPLRDKSRKTALIIKELITHFKRFRIELSDAFTYNEKKKNIYLTKKLFVKK